MKRKNEKKIWKEKHTGQYHADNKYVGHMVSEHVLYMASYMWDVEYTFKKDSIYLQKIYEQDKEPYRN